MTLLGVSEASCRAWLERLRLNVAWVKWTVAGLRDGVVLAAGCRSLEVDNRVLCAALLMDARLKRRLAGSCHLWGLPNSQAREEWAFVFSIQLVLQVRQEAPSLDAGVNTGQET